MWVIDNNSTGLLIEDGEIGNRPSLRPEQFATTRWVTANFTLRRTEIRRSEKHQNIGGLGEVTMEDSWIHNLDTTGPSYVWGNSPTPTGDKTPFDGEQHRDPPQHHRPCFPCKKKSGMSLTPGDGSPVSSTLVEDNYIDGTGTAGQAIYAARITTHDVYIRAATRC